MCIDNHTRLVFIDEKMMKEIDILGTVRKDPSLGSTPNHEMETNSKNRYIILAVVTLKIDNVSPVEYTILEDNTKSCIFLQVVRTILGKGILEMGDIFVVDNCSIHLHGENIGIQEELFVTHGVLKITLPPYRPELNSIELVSNTLLQHLRRSRAKYNFFVDDFIDVITIFLDKIDHNDVISFYNNCDY